MVRNLRTDYCAGTCPMARARMVLNLHRKLGECSLESEVLSTA